MYQNDAALLHKLYHDACYTTVARTIGYDGCTYRELQERLEPLRKQFGTERVESAVYYLVEFEGQMTVNPKPLAHVQFRADVRQHCWQLLGPPPEHPWYELWKHKEPLPLSWQERAAAQPRMPPSAPASPETAPAPPPPPPEAVPARPAPPRKKRSVKAPEAQPVPEGGEPS